MVTGNDEKLPMCKYPSEPKSQVGRSVLTNKSGRVSTNVVVQSDLQDRIDSTDVHQCRVYFVQHAAR